MAGTYVLTDTINESFEDIFDVSFEGTDVAVSEAKALSETHRNQANIGGI